MMYRKLIGLTLFALLSAGFSLPAHAQSANDWIRAQEATDPGYQSALRGGSYLNDRSANYYYNSTPSYSYPSSSYGYPGPYSYPYVDQYYTQYGNQYQYDQYGYSYSYNRDRIVDSFNRDGCRYTVHSMNGSEYVTRNCDR